MDATIRTLEYTLKDDDVQSSLLLTQQIQQVVKSLREVMAIKQQRWAEQEEKDGSCPCGCGSV
jgi:hypothetical protein